MNKFCCITSIIFSFIFAFAEAQTSLQEYYQGGIGYANYGREHQIDLSYIHNPGRKKEFVSTLVYSAESYAGKNYSRRIGLRMGYTFYFTEANLKAHFSFGLSTALCTYFKRSHYTIYDSSQVYKYSINENITSFEFGPVISFRITNKLAVSLKASIGPGWQMTRADDPDKYYPKHYINDRVSLPVVQGFLSAGVIYKIK